MTSVTKLYGGAFLIAGLAYAGLAFAEGANVEPGQTTIASAPAAEEIMNEDELGTLFGGTGEEAVIITDQTLQAVNHDNSVTGDVVTSGDISLSRGALSNFDGIGNFVMNTGHNNNLQSSMSVSILLGPGS